jgi:lysophospholipase L1-like esterase
MSRPPTQTIRRAAAALRTAWLLLGLTLLLLLAVELALRGAFALKDRISGPPAVDPRVIRDGYGGESWPVEHVRELEALAPRWEPYAYFRQRPFAGRTITIDEAGRRAVWRPPAAAEPAGRAPARILLLGGSSLWGYGARDDRTIPSILARSLHERGVAAEFRNLSEIGYVNTQELVVLARELQSGYRPDVVLFYDGVNDTTSALLAGKPTLTTNEVNRAREFNLLQSPGRLIAALVGRVVADSAMQRLAQSIGRRILGAPTDLHPVPAADPAVLARGVVDGYRANVAIVDALAARYGFRPLFVWQPVVFSKAKPTPFEREEAGKYAWTAPIFAEVARAIEAAGDLRDRPDFVNLADVFREVDDLVFIDYCHTTEAGNARVAEVLFRHVDQIAGSSR